MRMSRRQPWCLLCGFGWALLVLAATPLSLKAAEPARSPGEGEPVERPDRQAQSAREAFFETDVRPLLIEKCYACHGPDKQKGALRLDSREALLRGGETGPAVVPGRPDESLLVEAIRYDGPEMPPAGKLSAAEIATLTRWVALGTPWPRNRPLTSPSRGGRPADRSHWSFQPIRTQEDAERTGTLAVPSGTPWERWSRTTVDRFILKGLLDQGLAPAPEADRRALIRRATLDLTGLPPTPEEVEAFVRDPAPDAYERVIDGLLASPQYGQRWASHWLDLVRYAESDGHRQDAYRPDAWRYRDYVVRAFNIDKPYDRFLTEQLAGDQLDPSDLELRVATGYFRLGLYEFNQRDVRGQWANTLNDITDVTGEVFLGLSVGCARCHDHKFDPISQRDYYRLQAFFAPILPRDDLPLAPAQECAEHARRQAVWECATAEIRRQIAELEQADRDRAAAGAVDKFQPDIKAILAKPAADRTPLEVQLAALAARQVVLEREKEPALKGDARARRDALKQQLARFDATKPARLPGVMTVVDVGASAPPTTIPGKAAAGPIAPGFLSVLDPAPARLDGAESAPSTGRRLVLARWLCSDENPLPARVMVNRIWQSHFGTGLVATSSDLGHLGEAPSHPELLDWLAREFVAGGWRLKSLHRLLMTSAVYRQSAEPVASADALAERVDPENRLLHRRTVQRMEAETLRDVMLAVSGELAVTLGGPGAGTDRPWRAIDTRFMRNSRDDILDAFDAPNGYNSVGRRSITTTPTQALLLINGSWTLARARALAERLERQAHGPAESRIDLAYQLAFGREPDAEERTQAVRFLAAQSHRILPGTSRPDFEALVDFCHVLMNSSELIYVD